ncbi:type II toxin-antitoxin system VapC family toxin [Baaleninema sp.]|uniref:type II toxin-antitoxin system VapC family toxin n=1 Tax=Baaleninema sp. TaxID=3101197 RepID=UPI0028FA4264|nr:PIN domain-containing protein [Geitlerinema sp. CS-897]
MDLKVTRKAEVFLDTSYIIALANFSDEYHSRAVQLSRQLKSEKIKVVTTRGILLEIGNALSRFRLRSQSIQILRILEKDSQVTIIPLSEALYFRAFKLYSQRLDKQWGLVDCISFVVMEDHQIQAALTADVHFRQAGFQALLLD